MSRSPSMATMATCIGRLASWPWRIFTWIASMNVMGQTASRGEHAIADLGDRLLGDLGHVGLLKMRRDLAMGEVSG
jgi:hypothetical protein